MLSAIRFCSVGYVLMYAPSFAQPYALIIIKSLAKKQFKLYVLISLHILLVKMLCTLFSKFLNNVLPLAILINSGKNKLYLKVHFSLNSPFKKPIFNHHLLLFEALGCE